MVRQAKKKAIHEGYKKAAAQIGDHGGLSWHANVFSTLLNVGWFLPALLPSKKGLPMDLPWDFGFLPFCGEMTLSEKALAFLRQPEPFLLIAMGSHDRPDAKGAVARALLFAKHKGWRAAIVGSSSLFEAANAFGVKADCFTMEPLLPFMQKATVVLHHGGAGTLSDCCFAGVPNVAVPLAFDQFKNANRGEEIGISVMARSNQVEKAMKRALKRTPSALWDTDDAGLFIQRVIKCIEA